MPVFNKKLNSLIFINRESVDLTKITPTLKVLVLSEYFDEIIEKNVLPNSLEVLIFSSRYNRKIDKNILPPNLKVLIFGHDFNKEFDEGVLPNNLKVLKLGLNYRKVIKKNILPENLEIFIISNDIHIEKYPLKLKKFIFKDFYCAGKNKVFNLSVLPENIEFLDLKFLGGFFSNLIFPKLKILQTKSYNFNSFKWLPDTLKYLEIYNNISSWDEEEDYLEYINYKILPLNLEYLVLGENKLNFFDETNSENNNIIMFQDILQNLKFLSIDGTNEQLNILNNLPSNLSVIKFTNLSTTIDNLPTNLKEIYLFSDSQRKYLQKIPFDCNVIIYKDTTQIIENYLLNSTFTLTSEPTSILKNIIDLDDIGIQYYSMYF